MVRVLMAGVNAYPTSPLKGCLNDLMEWWAVLIKIFGVPADNIRVLTDARVTSKAIQDRFRWMSDLSRPGDTAFFIYSGHGSQIRDRSGDELEDGLDEIICPYDMDWNNPLSDDVFAEMLKRFNRKVNVYMIFDSCHSGTMSRNPGSDDRRPKSMVPPMDIALRSEGRDLPLWRIRDIVEDVRPKVACISACQDNQTAADAMIAGGYHGAFTYFFLHALRELPNGSLKEVVESAALSLKAGGYEQVPNLTGLNELCDSSFRF